MMHLGGPLLAYEATLATLHLQGYPVDRRDPHRGRIVVPSKVDQKPGRANSDRLSWITFQAYRDGSLSISASGYHVKADEGLMHRKLAAEIEDLRHSIYQQARAMYDASVSEAPAVAR
jgi:hypothetical protein